MVDMKVNFPAMQQARTDFENAEEANQQTKIRLEGTIESLKASWTGDAQIGFSAVMRQWGTKFTEVQRALNRLTTTLDANLKGYQNTEQNQVQASSPITNALGSVSQVR